MDEFLQISMDFALYPQQKLQYFFKILSKDAQKFYLERVFTYSQSLRQDFDMYNKEYNSHVRQNRVKNYLSSLHISSLVTKGDELFSAFSMVYPLIKKLSRQIPASHGGDAHKIESHFNAAIEYAR